MLRRACKTPYALTRLVLSSKLRQKMMATLSTRGLNLPLKHAGVRNKRGEGSLGSEAASQSRPPPTRLSAAQEPSCFVGWPSLASFLGHTRKEGPAGGPHLNQRAEGTKKVFFILCNRHGCNPPFFHISYSVLAGCTSPTYPSTLLIHESKRRYHHRNALPIK
jgi:hypothetical protein